MNSSPTVRVLATAATALVATVILAAPASAAPDAPRAPEPATDVNAALRRDLHATDDVLKVRLQTEERAARLEPQLKSDLGTAFGGAWLNAEGTELIVATTDALQAKAVRTAGARPVVVRHSLAELDAVKQALDHLTPVPGTVHGWYVDVPANSVVVQASVSTSDFVAAAKKLSPAVRVVDSAERPRVLDELISGNGYLILQTPSPAVRCSIGFAVQGGYVTAGHCGAQGTAALTLDQRILGSVQSRSYPGNDYAFVSTTALWTPRGVVRNYSSGTLVPVAGSQEAVIGASVCRSGGTTGWRCGTIQAKNQTANYGDGAVSGLTRTSACAEPGDSGGSILSGNQAQGVTSGGTGNCTIGGTTLFQPINPILSAYGLTLVTNDFSIANSASFETGVMASGSFVTLYTAFPVTDEQATFAYPWVSQTPGGLSVQSGFCGPSLRILYVGPAFGGNQINLYYPNDYQGGSNTEPFTCSGTGSTKWTVHPKAGFGSNMRRENYVDNVRPGIFMNGSAPSGYHLNATTGQTIGLADCNADLSGTLCPVSTNGAENFLVVFTTGGEKFGCPNPSTVCTPPYSGLTFQLAPVGGGYVQQDVTFYGWAGFLGQEQANIRIKAGTPPGALRLRLTVPAPFYGSNQQLPVRLGAAN